MKVDASDKIDTLGVLCKLGLGVRATNVLFQMGLRSAAQLTALDEQTLLRRGNCGRKAAAEIMEAERLHKPTIEAALGATEAMSPSAAMEHMPVTDLLLSVRATGALERLKI